jgi:DNA uptake protein ComE-like DNA-binding protein
MKTFFNIIYGVLIGLLAGGIIWLAASRSQGDPVTLLATSTLGKLSIYVSGAVATPGVYELSAGSRIDAAVRAAGGFAPGAEQEQVNLAALLVDGQQINIPGVIDANHINTRRVNIN